jgi:hypothetical protein
MKAFKQKNHPDDIGYKSLLVPNGSERNKILD